MTAGIALAVFGAALLVLASRDRVRVRRGLQEQGWTTDGWFAVALIAGLLMVGLGLWAAVGWPGPGWLTGAES